MNEQEIKKLKAEHFDTLSTRTRTLIRLGIIRYWAEQDEDTILFKHQLRWWNPMAWIWAILAYVFVSIVCIVSAPLLIVAVPFEGVIRMWKLKVSGGVAVDSLNVEPKKVEE